MGPGSVAWRVLSDVPSALVGGISGILVGTLHPVVLGGTLEHTSLYQDPIARLGRTASFVLATTFASTEVAEYAVAHVNRMHSRVTGTGPDGQPYQAADAELLIWTHVTVYGGFLAGHLAHHPRPIADSDIDQYWDDIAVVAERLGATGVPRSQKEVDAFLEDVRPRLAATPQALEEARWILESGNGDSPTVRGAVDAVIAALAAATGGSRLVTRVAESRAFRWLVGVQVRLVYRILVGAGVRLTPDWAGQELGLQRRRWSDLVSRPATFALILTLRLLIGTPSEIRDARERAGRGERLDPGAPAP